MFSLFYTGLHPCFVVFDVLLVNGKSIASLPLKERLANLEKYDNATNSSTTIIYLLKLLILMFGSLQRKLSISI